MKGDGPPGDPPERGPARGRTKADSVRERLPNASRALDRSRAYVFLLRDASGAEWVGVREFRGRWRTRRLVGMVGSGRWRVRLLCRALWRRGPRMVLEVEV